ncbi:hypothetical protein TRFO_14193 [Tritrichomonas foetus]|uniref:Attractin/MKLN-like beta-propeller domain-containing protein n=1 Tax=Tritrichomonas foetus TaxID=1144522 RepID=A0A1J4L031_9EUKA|nr:hypothetical protein TRFO_14193 [Tritrichomonas foetus]|eukprot:OHT15292.1 hypothetical protein TRFO_14193 [Tritrichomonas foetus]
MSPHLPLTPINDNQTSGVVSSYRGFGNMDTANLHNIEEKNLNQNKLTNEINKTSSQVRFDLGAINNSSISLGKMLHKVPYHAKWSITCSQSLSPQPRVGHFFATSKKHQKTFVGCGKNDTEYLKPDEVWEFDHNTHLWKRIAISSFINGKKMPPSEEACSTIFEDEQNNEIIIFVFGGKKGSKFWKDLTAININQKTIEVMKRNGSYPPGLAGAFMSFFEGNIFIWGGIDKKGKINQTLYSYNLHTKRWENHNNDKPTNFNNTFTHTNSQSSQDKKLNQSDKSVNKSGSHSDKHESANCVKNVLNESGRYNASCVTIDGKMYIFGGLKESSLMCINLHDRTSTSIQTSGLSPIPDYHYGRLLPVKDHLFYFGGKANNKFTLLYALDMKRNWWFVFHVQPDFETVSIENGKINDNGFFMVPRIHSFGCCYAERRRSIVAFLGYPMLDPPQLFELSLGEAFGFINLRNDMLDIMRIDFGPVNDEFEVPIDE